MSVCLYGVMTVTNEERTRFTDMEGQCHDIMFALQIPASICQLPPAKDSIIFRHDGRDSPTQVHMLTQTQRFHDACISKSDSVYRAYPFL
jgi:hypothetical protein